MDVPAQGDLVTGVGDAGEYGVRIGERSSGWSWPAAGANKLRTDTARRMGCRARWSLR